MTGGRRGTENLRARLLDELEAARRTLDGAAAAAAGLLADQCRLDGPPPGGTRREQEALADVGARERRRLTGLLDALRRLERGDYGACSRCGGAIEDERLELLPATERCAACADA
ncbi:MAG: TraR/DksA C4-type zinc finger protein [Gemmatimonadetes bacterium]|nr:TraR/DksA C4-type zinc finger protein [Gemmatimonadota bacterium]